VREAVTNLQEFDARLELNETGTPLLVVPFDPSQLWGPKQRHFVRGRLNGVSFHGSIGERAGRYFVSVNKWLRARARLRIGDRVQVTLQPGDAVVPDVPADLERALAGRMRARAFFETLPPFYQRGYVLWIEAAKRGPLRNARIQTAVDLLNAGKRQHA
jgi:hypothetical protein